MHWIRMEIKQTYIFLTFHWSNPFIDRCRVVGTVIFCQKDVTTGSHARQAGGDSLIFNNFHQGPDVWVWAGCWQASWWLSNIMTPPSCPALARNRQEVGQCCTKNPLSILSFLSLFPKSKSLTWLWLLLLFMNVLLMLLEVPLEVLLRGPLGMSLEITLKFLWI